MSIDPFKDFEETPVRPDVSKKVMLNSKRVINPDFLNLSLKYSLIFITTVFFSLAICPQKGVGLFRKDLPLFHHILHQSEMLCGLYCGFLFFTTTHLLTFFLLSHFERVKIVKHVSYLPALFISAFFGLSMTSIFSSTGFGLSYNLSWIFIVGASYYLANQLFLRKIQRREA